MKNIDMYNNSKIILERQTPKFMKIWITILLIFMFLILFIPFNIYKSYVGKVIINNNNSFIEFSVNDFPIKKSKLYINDKKYNYEIIELEDKCLIKINLDNNIKINNNIVTLNFLNSRTTVFNILKNKIKKRWYNEKN